jgi:hypothetical protein
VVQLHSFLTSALNGSGQPYAPGKQPQYPLNQRLSGPQSQSGDFGEQEVSCPCPDSNSGSSNP